MKRCGRVRILWFSALAVCAVSCSHAPDAPLDRAAALISTDHIGRLGRALTSDEMSGRYYASPEADSAAGVILAHLRALHLPLVQRAENLLGSQPACFAHHFSVTLYRLGGRNRLASGGGEHGAELGRDFVPLVFSRSQSAEGRCVRLDGIAADAAVPLAGAVVVVDLHGTRPSDAELYARVRRFEARGAAGVVFAGDARLLTSAATTYPTHLSSEQHAVADSPRGVTANLSSDRMSLAAQAQVWRDADERTIPAAVVRSSWSDRLPAGDTMRLDVDLEPEVSLGQNVLVGFRGTTRPDEIVVLGANYDHAGVNAAGEVLHGANDNASGVAALVEVATALAAATHELQRSVVVAFFSASRAGLQGSEMLLHDWSLLFGPSARPAGVVALRGIGRDDGNPLLVIGGLRHAELAAVFERHDRREELLGPVLAVQRYADEAVDVARLEIVPSRGGDQMPFAHAGVPAVLLTGGMDAGPLPTPDDDWKSVSEDKIARVARLVFRACVDLASVGQAAILPARSPSH